MNDSAMIRFGSLDGVDWVAIFNALIIIGAAIGLFVVMRWLVLRQWRSLRARRVVWFLELLILPLLIIGARQILLGLEDGEALATAIRLTIGVVLCFAFAWLVDRGIGLFLLRQAHHDGATAGIPRILRTGIRIAVYAVALLAAFTLVLDRSAFGFVVSGSVLLGVLGLALQGVLQDAFAGVALSIDEPFRLGDWIELEDGTVGQVVDISWRATRLRTFQRGILVVPNHQAASARIHNHTHGDARLGMMLNVHLSNEVDPAMGRRLLLEAMLGTPGVLADPPPSVYLADGGGRPYRYLLYFACADFPSRWLVMSKVYESVWRYLRPVGLHTAPAASDHWLQRGRRQEVMEDNLESLLRNTPLFAPLNDNELAALQASISYRVFPAGVSVVTQGEPGESLFIIAGGQVQVTVGERNRAGNEIARLGVGDYFGEISLLTGAPRSAHVRTITECTLIEVDKDALLPILSARPELGEALAEVEARRQIEMEKASRRNVRHGHADIGVRARQMLARMQSFFRL